MKSNPRFPSFSLIVLSLALMLVTAPESRGQPLPDCYTPVLDAPDYEAARTRSFACLERLEARLAEQPHDRALLLLLAEAYGGLSLAFAEDEMEIYELAGDPRYEAARSHAHALFRKGRDYAGQVLLRDHPGFSQARRGPPEAFRRYLDAHTTQADVPALFWYAYNWGSLVGLSRDDPAVLAEVPGLRALADRLIALDAAYLYGGAHVLLGLLDVTLPPFLGGDLERGRTHFLRAQALNGGAFLFGQVEYAHFYAVRTGDRPLFERTLQAVLEAPEDLLPDRHRLLTILAQRKAARLLQHADVLFPADPSALAH